MSLFEQPRTKPRLSKAIFVAIGVISGLCSLLLVFGVIGLGFSLLTDGDGNRGNLRLPIAWLICVVGSVLTGVIAKRSLERAIFD